jgi:hypothetical protein
MISRWSAARDRSRNRTEWSEATTDNTRGGYRRTGVTSIEATCTLFSGSHSRLVFTEEEGWTIRAALERDAARR